MVSSLLCGPCQWSKHTLCDWYWKTFLKQNIRIRADVILNIRIRGCQKYDIRFITSVLAIPGWCTRHSRMVQVTIALLCYSWCSGLFPFVPTFLSFRFLTTLALFLSASSSCSLFPCARYPVWDTHPVHGILIVHADWSLIFLSFRIMLCCVEKHCSKPTTIIIIIIIIINTVSQLRLRNELNL